MSAWFSRLSPSGRRVASGHEVIHVDGRSLGLPGTSPQWLDERTLLYIPQPSGPLQRLLLGWPAIDAGVGVVNEWHTQGGHIVGWPATTPLRGPTVSASGILAGIRDLGGSGELVVNDQVIDRGVLYEARFSGDVLVWSKVEGGVRRTYGRRSIVAQTELLSVDPARDEFWPVAIETPAGLFVLNHGHDRCFIRAWGARQVIWSYVGVTDYPDARWNGAVMIRIVASDRGRPLDFTADPTATPVDLYPPTPFDPPPPPPPDPDVPDPPPPTGDTSPMQLPDAVYDTIAACYEKLGLPEGEEAQRAVQEKVCQTVRARHGASWGWKRASGPPSADAVAFNHGDGTISVWDCVRDAGGPERQFSLGRGSEGERVRQTFIAVEPKDWLATGTGEPPPPDPGEPEPPTGTDLSAVHAKLDLILAELKRPIAILRTR